MGKTVQPTVDAPARNPRPLPEDGTNPTGLPRPLATLEHNGKARLAPVPWTQEGDRWAVIDSDAANKANRQSLCLMCGDEVENGVVLAAKTHGDEGYRLKTVYRRPDLNREEVLDNAPLHDRCAKMAAHHCPHLKGNSNVISKPYRR